MEYNWSVVNNSSARGHNGNFSPSPNAWDFSSSWDLSNYYPAAPPPNHAGGANTTMYCNPDPHLTCLKLGKRHYFGDLSPPPPPNAVMRRAKGGGGRCQVEGCEAPLLTAKEYHRRHKVCEMHAKAPKVVLAGIDQRFCQQCSRFHAVGEFDEAKRSCRRRLAGHNERRRKTSLDHNSFARTKQYHHDTKMVGASRNLVNNSGCALSLLSPWSASPAAAPDLPARCSAALRELIAENRASAFATQFPKLGWAGPENRGHVTLNLMQGPDSAFRLISGPSEEDGAGDCSELWKLPLGY